MLRRLIVLTLIVSLGLGLSAIAVAQDTSATSEDPEELQTGEPAEETDTESEAPKGNRFLGVMDKGGPIMYPLLFCSVLALAVIIERLHCLRTGRFYSTAMIDDLKAGLRTGDLDGIVAVGERFDRQALGRVVQRSVEEIREFDVGFEQALEDCSERELRGIHRYMKLLQSIGAIAPLLGLLGTVLGMIMAFDAIAEAAKLQELNKGVVAEGISQALITTATGLIIAIPALMGYGFFTSRIEHILSNFEGMLGDMVKLYRKAGNQ